MLEDNIVSVSVDDFIDAVTESFICVRSEGSEDRRWVKNGVCDSDDEGRA